jgi:RNA polymerase sigma-70 factor (ECF subfamily)
MKHPDIHLHATASALGQPVAGPELRDPAATDATPNLQALYDTHFAFVWRNLRRLGVPEGRVEDAAQEVFLVAHRRASSFDTQRSTAQTWLFGIVVHVANNERRAGRRRNARMAPASEHEFWDNVPSTAADPAELLAKREAARLLEQILESLSERGRAILVMVDIESMSVPQAAEALNVNLNTAYGRLRTARADFEQALKRFRAQQPKAGPKP